MPTVSVGYSVPYFYPDSNPHKPASISGAGNVWDDDLTNIGYTTSWLSRRSTGTVTDRAVADLEPVDLPPTVNAISLTAVVWTWLYDELNATGSRYELAFLEDLETGEGLRVTPGGGGYLTAMVDGWQFSSIEIYPSAQSSLFEFREIATDEIASPERVRALFAAGCFVALSRFSIPGDSLPGDYGIRVSYLRLDLTWSAGMIAPPLRRRQRNDGALSAPRRNSRASSQQRSLRNRGYL